MGSSPVPITDDTEAHLIIEVDGNHPETLMNEMESISELLTAYDCGEVYFADDARQKAELWKLRRRVAEAVKLKGYTIEEDTVVPRAELPALIRGVKELGHEYDFHAVCYGHAGDGNLHIRIKKEGTLNSLEDPAMVKCLRALFELVKRLGGTIRENMGLGWFKKNTWILFLMNNQLETNEGDQEKYSIPTIF